MSTKGQFQKEVEAFGNIRIAASDWWRAEGIIRPHDAKLADLCVTVANALNAVADHATAKRNG